MRMSSFLLSQHLDGGAGSWGECLFNFIGNGQTPPGLPDHSALVPTVYESHSSPWRQSLRVPLFVVAILRAGGFDLRLSAG